MVDELYFYHRLKTGWPSVSLAYVYFPGSMLELSAVQQLSKHAHSIAQIGATAPDGGIPSNAQFLFNHYRSNDAR